MVMKAIIEFLKQMFRKLTFSLCEVWKGFEWAEQNRHHNQWGKF
jgi:hypothetical protein